MCRKMKLLLLGTMACSVVFTAPVRGEEPLLGGVSAGSYWFAHLNYALVRGSPLEDCLTELAAENDVRDLPQLITGRLGIREADLKSATLFADGQPEKDVVLILRGSAEPEQRENVITEKIAWEDTELFIKTHSGADRIAGTSPVAVQRAVELLDGKATSWRGVRTPAGLDSAAAVFALDLGKLREVLEFESEITRSLRHLWMIARPKGAEVELSVWLDSEDPARLDEIEDHFRFLMAALAAEARESTALPGVLGRIVIENKDGWLNASLTLPPAELNITLNALAPFFAEPDTAAEETGED